MGVIDDKVREKSTPIERAKVKAEEHHKEIQSKLAIEVPFKFTWTVEDKEKGKDGKLDIEVQVFSSSWTQKGSLYFDNIKAFYLDAEKNQVWLNLNLPYIITNPPIWTQDGTHEVDDGKGGTETLAKFKESLEDSIKFMIGRIVERQKDRK